MQFYISSPLKPLESRKGENGPQERCFSDKELLSFSSLRIRESFLQLCQRQSRSFVTTAYSVASSISDIKYVVLQRSVLFYDYLSSGLCRKKKEWFSDNNKWHLLYILRGTNLWINSFIMHVCIFIKYKVTGV